MAALMNMDLLMDEETAGRIAADLIGVGCCPRCVLRHLGEKTTSTYKQTAEELKELLVKLCGERSEPLQFSSEVCPACLGILQQLASTDFIHSVKDQVDQAGYQFTSYQCALYQPVCLPVRQRAMILYLKDKYECYEKTKESDIPSTKDVWKWFSGPILNEVLGTSYQHKSAFEIGIYFEYSKSDDECTFLLDLGCGIQRQKGLKKHNMQLFNQTNVASALRNVKDEVFRKSVQCPPRAPAAACEARVTCSHDAVFVAGRYSKFSRILSQTPWVVDGARKTESSIQELICQKILEEFKPSDHKFSSAGREDVDVRMLGSGRPFVVELVDPHRVKFSAEELWDMQQAINSSTTDVQVRDFQIVLKEEVETLKIAEMEKTKSYMALCWSPDSVRQEDLDKLADIRDLTLDQKTPIRVLHRRPLHVRQRMVHSMMATKKDDHHFNLELSTQAGTYVKEFVHGDFGRTQPNLSSLLGHDCDILELDVTMVNVDWPKKVSPPATCAVVDSASHVSTCHSIMGNGESFMPPTTAVSSS